MTDNIQLLSVIDFYKISIYIEIHFLTCIFKLRVIYIYKIKNTYIYIYMITAFLDVKKGKKNESVHVSCPEVQTSH